MENNLTIDFEHDEFDFDAENELLIDEKCKTILYHFYQNLQLDGMESEKASEIAFAADCFVRDYLLDNCCMNIVKPVPGIVKQFAGNWFITHTLDPEMEQLEKHCRAIALFYRFLHKHHFISEQELDWLLLETEETAYYKARLDSFYAISGDGYENWNRECPPNKGGGE